MSSWILATVAVACLAFQANASDPATLQPTRNGTQPIQPSPHPTLVAIERAKAGKQRVTKIVGELMGTPVQIVIAYAWGILDPNYRMNLLLNESEDLRQAREEMRRFWMNNQPAVLTYEKLHGAIGPKR
jgi:hypothetical protein